MKKLHYFLSILILLSLIVAACVADRNDDDAATADDDGTPDDDHDDATDDDSTDDDAVDDDSTIADDDDSIDDDTPTVDDDSTPVFYRITDVEVEDYITYRLMNRWFPGWTGDLWPCAWGEDDRLYTVNGDGFGFGPLFSDIVFNIVDGYPPDLEGSRPPHAYGRHIAGLWGPNKWEVNRKPTGLVCVDGIIYLFYQNLKNGWSDNPFGDAPHASISVTRDHGLTWEYEAAEPMFTDHIFTTGFFLDYGKCQENAMDNYVYVYGLDYNWRFSEGFSQTKMYLARVDHEYITDRSQWEFVIGFIGDQPLWSEDIDLKYPVLEDDTLYHDEKSGIAQGSVIYIPQLNRYLYSTRAVYEWIFYEAAEPWGPWTKVSVIEWTGGWTEDFHAGYNAVIPTKFLAADGRSGWIVSSLSTSYFDSMYYNMGFRQFWLTVE